MPVAMLQAFARRRQFTELSTSGFTPPPRQLAGLPLYFALAIPPSLKAGHRGWLMGASTPTLRLMVKGSLSKRHRMEMEA